MSDDSPTAEEEAASAAEIEAEALWTANAAKATEAINVLLDVMDDAPDSLGKLDLATVTMDALHHRLIQSGATKHQIAAMLRKVARDL